MLLVMSVFSPMPVPMLANTQGHHHDARQHEPQVGMPALALDRAAEQEHEQRHEDDRRQRDIERLLRVAPEFSNAQLRANLELATFRPKRTICRQSLAEVGSRP
jgi:hypothetical protein